MHEFFGAAALETRSVDGREFGLEKQFQKSIKIKNKKQKSMDFFF